jgi:hypothetical protein
MSNLLEHELATIPSEALACIVQLCCRTSISAFALRSCVSASYEWGPFWLVVENLQHRDLYGLARHL